MATAAKTDEGGVADKWMAMARALVPDTYAELCADWDAKAPDSVMHLFFILLPQVRTAINDGDDEFARRAFAFAEWCMWQPEDDLWNAAGVAFYEHVLDEERHTAPVCAWLSAKVFSDIESLLTYRYPAERVANIRMVFQSKKKDRSREAKDLANAAERSLGGSQ